MHNLITRIKKIMCRYRDVPHTILFLIGAELTLHLVTSSFILILNIYLSKLGYTDADIANFNSFRFMGVMVFAFPLGMFIKGRRLKPFFILAASLIPLSSLLMLEAAQLGAVGWIKIGCLLWGLGMMLIQVCVLPFIMRNAPEDVLSESISLNFSTWSLAMLMSGFTIYLLSLWGEFNLAGITFPWDEYHILRVFIFTSLLALVLVLLMREKKPDPTVYQSGVSPLRQFFDYDWGPIMRALVPTILISVGAGLTIPFMNLFFFNVFHVDSEHFSALGSVTSLIVFNISLLVPTIRRRFGYRRAVLIPQTIAVTALALMALTELIAHIPGVVLIALLCYILRQPMMHMAVPVVNELTMTYVGPKNQELISALNSSVWSGSWFISAKLFQYMRAAQLPYYRIFLITAFLYGLGVVGYHFLIKDFFRRGLATANRKGVGRM